MSTINVKSWADGQGEFVTIDVATFDPAIHQRLDGDNAPLPGPYDAMSRDQLIDLAVESFRSELATFTDQDLRSGLEGVERRRQALERGASLIETAADKQEREPDGYLLGSSLLPAQVPIGAMTVALGGLVLASQRESGLTVNAWNDLDEPIREGWLAGTLGRLAADPDAAAAEIDASCIVDVSGADADATKEKPAEVAPELTPGTDTEGKGLTKAEIVADLETLAVEFDPSHNKAHLLKLRNEARAKRNAQASVEAAAAAATQAEQDAGPDTAPGVA